MSTLTKQSFWKLILSAALLALLAGCGDDGDQTGQPAPDEAEMTEPDPERETTTGSSEQTSPPATEEASDDPSADAAASTDDNADSSKNSENESHTVKARATAFDPVAIQIKPGDTVRWTNMSGHNVHFEAGNIPEQAETYRSSLGDDVSRTFDVEGVYLYKCDPHFAMGMVGAIIVGEPTNMEAVEENAKGMYKRALAKAKAQL